MIAEVVVEPKKTIEIPVNTLVGNWKVAQPLGHGGQGSVWAVKPAKTKRSPQRALKACFAEDPQARARFEREVELLRRCESPNVLRVYDADLEWVERAGLPAFAFFVGEKCIGSLEERQRDLGDARRRLTIFQQACLAVSHLHGLPKAVIHRDIKPANFLIAAEHQNVVLADFGIARELETSSLTVAQEVVGTPYYRAPEVHHGQTGSVRSDVYGLGRLLEWLLTGEVSTDLTTRAVPRGVDLSDDTCDQLDRIVAKATSVSAANRYASVREMADLVPQLWFAVRPTVIAAPMVASVDASTVFPAAIDLARRGDQIGWRQLENQVRRDLPARLHAWRKEHERTWRDRMKEIAFPVVDRLVDAAMGRMVLAFAGVFSRDPVLIDQRRVVDDLTTVPDWAVSGPTAIFEGPLGLLYLFHHMHGALCVELGRIDLAIQLAEAQIPIFNRDELTPLWRSRGATGWPRVLGEDRTWAWEYLCGMRERQTVLEQFFALPNDYLIGLTSYSMLLSLLELGYETAKSKPINPANLDQIKLDFFPMFSQMPSELILPAFRRTFGNRQTVELVAERTRGKPVLMRELWPTWRELLQRAHHTMHRFADDMPLGDLG